MPNLKSALVLESGVDFSVVESSESGPFILVFLRHLGCLFCKQQVQVLKSSTARIYFVSHASVSEVQEFVKVFTPGHPVVSDTRMSLYQEFGMKKGGFGQMFSPRVIMNGVKANLAGLRQSGRPAQDPWILGGWALILEGGATDSTHPAKDASDILLPDSAEALMAKGIQNRQEK